MKIELVRNDEIANETIEPQELSEGVYLTANDTIFVIGFNDALKITR